MIQFKQALNIILDNSRELNVEKIQIENSPGRILMEDVYSQCDAPPFNKSAMDGYAVKATDIKRCPVKLKCIGCIEAGERFSKKVKRTECVKIMTGAMVPEGTDSVVMVEDTRQSGQYVEIMKPLKKWQNVCFQGEDIRRGQKVLEKRTSLSTSDIGLLATIGREFVDVVKKPEVGVLNTGGEIVPLGRKLDREKIYNSNGPQLLALLKRDGISARVLGIAKDKPQELTKAIRKGLENDILLVSGGVSMGDYDLVPDILRKLGVKEIFHKVNIKPGKPLFFGTWKNKIVFGIPGNPVSNFLAYHIFIRPALQKMAGNKHPRPILEEGVIGETFCHKPGREHFVLVKISKAGPYYYINPVESHGSADTLALSSSDGFMVVDANTRIVKLHSKIKFITWKREN